MKRQPSHRQGHRAHGGDKKMAAQVHSNQSGNQPGNRHGPYSGIFSWGANFRG